MHLDELLVLDGVLALFGDVFAILEREPHDQHDDEHAHEQDDEARGEEEAEDLLRPT